jgi:hypothetical protein
VECWGEYRRRFRVSVTAEFATAHRGSLRVWIEVCGGVITEDDPYMITLDTPADPPQCQWSFEDSGSREAEVDTAICGWENEEDLPPSAEDINHPPSIRIHWEYHLRFEGPEYCNPENASRLTFKFEWL